MTRRERVARALLKHAGCPVAYANVKEGEKEHWRKKAAAAIAAYEAALAEEGMVTLTPQAGRLVLRVLREHAANLRNLILESNDDDAVADAVNEVGYVEAVIAAWPVERG